MRLVDFHKWLFSIDSTRRISIFITVYAPPFVIFMAPALINGFPLVFSDSGTYLGAVIWWALPADRPIYYSIFLFPLHWRTTLWPIIAAQSAITIAVFNIFLRCNLAPLPHLHLALLLCGLAGLSGLPVLACQIMPDLFTPLMILSMCIVIFRSADVTSGERLFLYSVTLAALCFHQSNFMIFLLTAVFAIPLQLALDRSWHQFTRPFPAIGSLFALGLGLLVLPNYIAHKEIVITRGSGTFLLAKLLEDGPGLDYLTAKCRVQEYSICSQLPAIHHHKEMISSMQTGGAISDYFLWGGPLAAAGGWNGVAPYAGSIAVASILNEPRAFVLASLASFARQLVHFDTGDGLFIYDQKAPISRVLKDYFSSGVNRAYLASRQETGRLDLTIISYLTKLSVFVGLLVIIILLVGATDHALGSSVCTLLLAVIANAAVTGALSAVHDRYQNRVVGLIVVAAVTLSYSRLIPPKLVIRK